MPLEIERKFLVRNNDWRALACGKVRIRQGYAYAGSGIVRVRVAGQSAFLTLKSKQTNLVRTEFEYPIPLRDAEDLLAGFCELGVVEKTRYSVCYATHKWEVDVFEGANNGLVLAEIELTSPDQPFERPPWLGAEVSEDPAYFNSSLARLPFAQWQQAHPERM